MFQKKKRYYKNYFLYIIRIEINCLKNTNQLKKPLVK